MVSALAKQNYVTQDVFGLYLYAQKTITAILP